MSEDELDSVPDSVMQALNDNYTFVLPKEIGYRAYVELLNFLENNALDSVEIYCGGAGGDVDYGLAMVDLIEAHGNVQTNLVGAAFSCHTLVWSAGQTRTVSKRGYIAVHRPYTTNIDDDGNGLIRRGTYLKSVEDEMIKIYVAASNRDYAWWAEKINTSENYFRRLTSDTLIEIGMAISYSL